MTVLKSILAVIGALTVLATAGVAALSMAAHLADRRRMRGTRDRRAMRPAEQVAKSPTMWGDFWRDHGLHKLSTPKE